MSVRGEFQRILGDATAALRVLGESGLAERLERSATTADDSLEARAAAVLAGIEAVTEAEPRAALDHLGAICRVILGR